MFNINTYNEISKKIAVLGKKTNIIAVSKNHPKKAVEKLYRMELRYLEKTEFKRPALNLKI